MTSQDRQDRNEWMQNENELKNILDEIAPPTIFNDIKQNKGATWKPQFLVQCVFLWTTCNLRTLTESFDFAFRLFLAIQPSYEKTSATFVGFIGQLVKYHAAIKERIIPHLRELTKAKLKKFYASGKYFLLAIDGSENQTPRTKSNIKRFGAASKKKNKKKKPKRKRIKNKIINLDKQAKRKKRAKRKKQSRKDREKKANTPLLALTLLFHLASGLPWNWRIGGASSSERTHALEMIDDTPANTVFVADAGFVGYDFWKQIIDSGRHFIVRVGANVKLLKNLCVHERKGNIVYLWPDWAAKKNMPPLVLRLFHTNDGGQQMYLVTTLSESEMSDEELESVYRQRWSIEVFFRTFKQTFEKRTMKSRNPDHAVVELEWSLISLWVMCLYGKETLLQADELPSLLSPAEVVRAFQSVERSYGLPLRGVKDLLSSQLRLAVKDTYVRRGAKTNRDYPRKSQKKSIGEPKIIEATKSQRKRATQALANPI
jgi:IS4 transposase